MKQAIYIISISIFLLSQLAATAQRSEAGNERWKKYQTEKIAFLTANLELSPEEAQKFWPVYNQMDKERWAAQKMRREMEHELRETEETLSEKEALELTKKYAGSMQKEAGVHVSYNEKFLEILSPKKVLKLYKAENDFRMHMIRKYRDQRKNGEKHP
jgi:hypothetical protein